MINTPIESVRPQTRARYVLALMTLAAVALVFLPGCGPSAAPSMAAPPPAEVSIITIKSESLRLPTELPGRVTPVRTAQVRARVPGILLKQDFKEGTDVKAGDPLFEIDQAPLRASFASAKAALARAEANQKQARSKAGRYKALSEENAVSKLDFDDAVATALQADADVLASQAAVETAGLNLSYARVTAPIDGRIGRALATEGALVGQGESTPLALIQQLDPVYVDFTQSSTEILRLRRALESGRLKSAGAAAVDVTLVLEDGSTYSERGRLLFSDISVDPSTAMVSVRAEFPNPDRLLFPGMFVRGIVEQARSENSIAVPQRAVTRGANGSATLLALTTDDKVEIRTIQADTAVGEKWIVSSGLKDGDRVIVEGLQKARPGAVVKPVPFNSSPAK